MSLSAAFVPPTPAIGAAWFFAVLAIYTLIVFLFASEAYRERWLRHTLAPVTGEGLNQHLLRDFYPTEDLWDPQQDVVNRWRKLFAAYLLGAAAHLLFPSALAGFAMLVIGKISLKWVGIVLLGAAAVGVVFALIFSAWDARKLAAAGRKGETHA